MSNEKAKTADAIGAALEKALGSEGKASAGGVYTIECRDKDGNLKWTAKTPNLVVNVGLQDMNTQYFKGVSYTAAWYIGLYGAASSNNPAAGDTMALHPGWTEITPYSNASRPTATFGTASTSDPSTISNSASPAQYTINATAVVGGAFLVNNNTKGGSSGTLFSASDFQSPGDRTVASGDTLNVTYTFTLDAL
jgi:hypothetical protein